MADPIVLPPGAFAAARAGKPQPVAEVKPAAAAPSPKVEPKKAPPRETPAKTEDGGADTAPPANATAAEKKIWKLKAEGEEFEFDASDEEAVKREIMRARGSDKRFQSAAQMKQQAERFFEMIKNPETLEQVLSDPRVGIDVRKWAEQKVWEAIEAQKREEEFKKDPSAKKRWEDDQELARLRKQKADDEAAKAADVQKADVQKFEQHYEKTILGALELGGLPKTPEAAARMGQYLARAMESGMDLSPQDLVEVVRKDYQTDLSALLGEATGEQLLQILGEVNAKKLRDADLARLRNPQATSFPRRSEARRTAEKEPDAKPKRMSGSDWRAALAKDFLNRKK